MKKTFIILIILCFYCPQYAYSIDKELIESIKRKTNKQNCICLEFGFSNMYKVVLTDEQKGYKIYVQEKDKKNWTEIDAPELSILKWGIEEMPTELAKTEVLDSYKYNGLYCSVSCIENDSVVSSFNNSMVIKDNTDFETKLHQLISFLTNLWIECIAKD